MDAQKTRSRVSRVLGLIPPESDWIKENSSNNRRDIEDILSSFNVAEKVGTCFL